MTKIIKSLFLTVFLSVSTFAETQFVPVVLGGYADYKAQIGGGHYDMGKVDYFFDGNRGYKIVIDFAKKQNKFMFVSQEEEIFLDIINPRQVKIATDLEEQYLTLPEGVNNISLSTQKGKINIQLEIVRNR